VPHLQTGYRTEVVISSARTGFGEAVVEVIDRIIDLAPLPQVARSALQAVTHTVARTARTVWSFFFG
jgi:predicted GTPase